MRRYCVVEMRSVTKEVQGLPEPREFGGSYPGKMDYRRESFQFASHTTKRADWQRARDEANKRGMVLTKVTRIEVLYKKRVK